MTIDRLARDLSPGWTLVLGGPTAPGRRKARVSAARAAGDHPGVILFVYGPLDPPDATAHNPGPDGQIVTVVEYGGDRASIWGSLLAGLLRPVDAPRPLSILRKVVEAIVVPLANWLTVRPLLRRIRHIPPAVILYTDDHAMTAAWHAARMWEAARIEVRASITQ